MTGDLVLGRVDKWTGSQMGSRKYLFSFINVFEFATVAIIFLVRQDDPSASIIIISIRK